MYHMLSGYVESSGGEWQQVVGWIDVEAVSWIASGNQ